MKGAILAHEKAVTDLERFSCPGELRTGPGSLQCLKDLRAERLLVVTDPFFYENGTAQNIAREAAPKAVEFFHQITPDPSAELIARGTALARQFRPDVLLALGGGSALDCGKAITLFTDPRPKLVAIPTTSGSGSEVTDFAIITHGTVKHPVVDPRLRPDMAIVDPKLVEALPPALIADGGFDVLTHALEAYVAKNASPVTDALAEAAFRTCLQDLSASFHGDLQARGRVHTAATMAGLAFTNAGLGLCHALSHSLGGATHLPHGRLNAMLLPHVLCPGPKLARLARGAGLEDRSDTMAIRSLHNALLRLRRELHLPATLAEAGFSPGKLRQEEVIAAALADPCCATAPVEATEALLRQILRPVVQ